MNVGDLLIDHPATPNRHRFKALLPNLMTIFVNVIRELQLDKLTRILE